MPLKHWNAPSELNIGGTRSCETSEAGRKGRKGKRGGLSLTNNKVSGFHHSKHNPFYYPYVLLSSVSQLNVSLQIHQFCDVSHRSETRKFLFLGFSVHLPMSHRKDPLRLPGTESPREMLLCSLAGLLAEQDLKPVVIPVRP